MLGLTHPTIHLRKGDYAPHRSCLEELTSKERIDPKLEQGSWYLHALRKCIQAKEVSEILEVAS